MPLPGGRAYKVVGNRAYVRPSMIEMVSRAQTLDQVKLCITGLSKMDASRKTKRRFMAIATAKLDQLEREALGKKIMSL